MVLVDTYNVLKSGIPNAIKVFDEVLKPLGKRPLGIRIDSGDITYLTKKARKMLDDAGYPDAKICISNSLDEYLIRDMIFQGAKVDSYGVGERLITASSEAVFGGVYKLAAVEKNGKIIPKIKISENPAKITLPGVKIPWRLYDRETGKAIADVITLGNEKISSDEPYEIFDPEHTWKRKVVTDFVAKKLQVKIFERVSRFINLLRLRKLQSTAPSRLIRFGTRLRALKIRIPIMWIFPKSFGAFVTSCLKIIDYERIGRLL